MLMQNFGVTNKVHYGMLLHFLKWSISQLVASLLNLHPLIYGLISKLSLEDKANFSLNVNANSKIIKSIMRQSNCVWEPCKL